MKKCQFFKYLKLKIIIYRFGPRHSSGKSKCYSSAGAARRCTDSTADIGHDNHHQHESTVDGGGCIGGREWIRYNKTFMFIKNKNLRLCMII